jgi:hypothetical protein
MTSEGRETCKEARVLVAAIVYICRDPKRQSNTWRGSVPRASPEPRAERIVGVGFAKLQLVPWEHHEAGRTDLPAMRARSGGWRKMY